MGFSAKKAAKGADKALSGLDSQTKASSAARAAQSDADMADIRKDMSAKTAARVASNAASKPQSFSEAFRAARKDKGSGSTFTWNGKSYSTNLASESKTPPRSANKPAAPANKPAAPANKSTTAMPAKSNLEDIKAKGSALRASFSGPAPKPQPRPNDFSTPRRPTVDEVTRTDTSGNRVNLTPTQRQKLQDAINRGGTSSSWSPFRKGGSIDGCAIRGKTRAPLKGRKK